MVNTYYIYIYIYIDIIGGKFQKVSLFWQRGDDRISDIFRKKKKYIYIYIYFLYILYIYLQMLVKSDIISRELAHPIWGKGESSTQKCWLVWGYEGVPRMENFQKFPLALLFLLRRGDDICIPLFPADVFIKNIYNKFQ